MSTSLPRPALIALLGLVAVAAVFLMTRGHGGDSGASTPAPPAPAPQASTPLKPVHATKAHATKAHTTKAHTTKAHTTKAVSSPKAATPTLPKHPTSPARPRSHASSRTLPRPVARALNAHKVIVLLFWNPRGTDDRSVEAAVRSLSRRGGKVAVFMDRSKNVSRYTQITGPANVVQTPTLVVVNGTGQAQTATGYLDPATVDQYVVDALHGAP